MNSIEDLKNLLTAAMDSVTTLIYSVTWLTGVAVTYAIFCLYVACMRWRCNQSSDKGRSKKKSFFGRSLPNLFSHPPTPSTQCIGICNFPIYMKYMYVQCSLLQLWMDFQRVHIDSQIHHLPDCLIQLCVIIQKKRKKVNLAYTFPVLICHLLQKCASKNKMANMQIGR